MKKLFLSISAVFAQWADFKEKFENGILKRKSEKHSFKKKEYSYILFYAFHSKKAPKVKNGTVFDRENMFHLTDFIGPLYRPNQKVTRLVKDFENDREGNRFFIFKIFSIKKS